MGAAFVCLLMLLLILRQAVCGSDVIELTALFSSSANSSCTELSCGLPVQHTPAAVLDGDPATWWQSEKQDEPVLLSLHSTHNLSAFRVTAVLVVFRHPLPDVLSVYSDDQFQLQLGECRLQSPSNSTLCTISPIMSQVVTVKIDVSNTLQNLHLILIGYVNQSEQYYSVSEVYVNAAVLEGYYLPDPHTHRSEAEAGSILPFLDDPQTPAPTSSSVMMFPDFSGRGFAILNYPIGTNYELRLVLDLPANISYRLVAQYINMKQTSFPVYGNVAQGEMTEDIRFTLDGTNACTPHCYSEATLANNTAAHLTQQTGQLTVTLSLDGVHFLLDYIAAVPEAFFTGNTPANYSSVDCGIIDRSWEGTTPSKQECQRQILQISAQLHMTPQACECSMQSLNQSCNVLGGECFCPSPNIEEESVLGRACDTCPPGYFVNVTGCTACNCPNGDMCDVSSGQCVCEANVGGRQCDMCIAGGYGSPPHNCTLCDCNPLTTSGCNSTTGECICLTGVTGENCSECELNDHFLQAGGCQPCQCSSKGSVSLQCNDTGVCECKERYSGPKCDDCTVGFFYSVNGCSLCNCSQRTPVCRQNSNITDIQAEVCDCPPEYTGDSCQLCSENHYQTSNGTCEPCLCNSPLVCDNTTGQCMPNSLQSISPLPHPTTTFMFETFSDASGQLETFALPESIAISQSYSIPSEERSSGATEYIDTLESISFSQEGASSSEAFTTIDFFENIEAISTSEIFSTQYSIDNTIVHSVSEVLSTAEVFTIREALKTVETSGILEVVSVFESLPSSQDELFRPSFTTAEEDSTIIDTAIIETTEFYQQLTEASVTSTETFSSLTDTTETTFVLNTATTQPYTHFETSSSKDLMTSYHVITHLTTTTTMLRYSSTMSLPITTPSSQTSSPSSTTVVHISPSPTAVSSPPATVVFSDHPLPSPEQRHLVIARLIVPQDDYTNLLMDQSAKKVELEDAVALEYRQAVLQFFQRNHLIEVTISKVVEVGTRDSNSGETPIIFYVLSREQLVPGAVVVAVMTHAQVAEINGYRVVSIGVVGADDNLVRMIAGSVGGAVALLCVLVAMVTLLCVGVLWYRKRRRTNRVDVETQHIHSQADVGEAQPLTEESGTQTVSTNATLPRLTRRSDSHISNEDSADVAVEAESPATLFESVAHYAHGISPHPRMRFHPTIAPALFRNGSKTGATETENCMSSENPDTPESDPPRSQPNSNAMTENSRQTKSSKQRLKLPPIGRSLHALPFKHKLTGLGHSSHAEAFAVSQEMYWMQRGAVQLIKHKTLETPQHQSLPRSLAELADLSFPHHSQHGQALLPPIGAPQSDVSGLNSLDHHRGQLVWSPPSHSRPVHALQLTQLRTHSDTSTSTLHDSSNSRHQT